MTVLCFFLFCKPEKRIGHFQDSNIPREKWSSYRHRFGVEFSVWKTNNVNWTPKRCQYDDHFSLEHPVISQMSNFFPLLRKEKENATRAGIFRVLLRLNLEQRDAVLGDVRPSSNATLWPLTFAHDSASNGQRTGFVCSTFTLRSSREDRVIDPGWLHSQCQPIRADVPRLDHLFSMWLL